MLSVIPRIIPEPAELVSERDAAIALSIPFINSSARNATSIRNLIFLFAKNAIVSIRKKHGSDVSM